ILVIRLRGFSRRATEKYFLSDAPCYQATGELSGVKLLVFLTRTADLPICNQKAVMLPQVIDACTEVRRRNAKLFELQLVCRLMDADGQPLSNPFASLTPQF